jgi:hypothetical protein
MSQPTMIISDIPTMATTPGQWPLTFRVKGQEVSSRADLFTLLRSSEWHCCYLVTKPR